MAASGGAARGSGADRVVSALTGGYGGGSQPAVHELVNAILQLGYLPVQSSRSTPEEERLVGAERRLHQIYVDRYREENAAVGHCPALQPSATQCCTSTNC